MESKFCLSCGQPFQPYSHVPQQEFCTAPNCQHERKRRWKRNKLNTDPDYKANQALAQKAWIQRNPAYYHEYRDLTQIMSLEIEFCNVSAMPKLKLAPLQRWTRQSLSTRFNQAFTNSAWLLTAKLQRVTSGSQRLHYLNRECDSIRINCNADDSMGKHIRRVPYCV